MSISVSRIRIGSGPKTKRTKHIGPNVSSADINLSKRSAKNLKKGAIAHWGLETDFQALWIVTFQSKDCHVSIASAVKYIDRYLGDLGTRGKAKTIAEF